MDNPQVVTGWLSSFPAPAEVVSRRPGSKLVGQGPKAEAAFYRMARAIKRGNLRLVKKAIKVMGRTL